MAILTSYWLSDIAIVIAVILSAIYLYFKYQFQTWQKRGVPVPLEPSFPFGNFPGVNHTKALDQIMAEIYAKTPSERFVGCYLMSRPIIVIRDLEIVKSMFVKDFGSFHDRGFQLNTKKNPMTGHLFLMAGQDWRNIRTKLSPTFTASKMKYMFKALNEIGIEMQEVMAQHIHLPEVDIKDLVTRFTIDVFASVAFGLQAQTLADPNAEFREMGTELSNPSWRQVLKNLVFFVNPKLANLLPIDILPKFVDDFFVKMVQQTIDHRKSTNDKRIDFMKFLHDMEDMGYVKDADNHEKDLNEETRQKFDVKSAAAQAFIFFFAAYETTSTTMMYILYELAKNQELQKQVQDEVDEYNEKYNGDIPYEAIMEMDLMERLVHESLRKYPVSPVLIRECATEYQVPNSDTKFMPGDQMWFPIYGYHHDPQYYPDPEKFDPDRFLPEIKATRPFFSWLPFGEGPRNCIGNRFGMMEVKTGLALLLSRFSFYSTKNTPDVIDFEPGNSILTPKNLLFLKIAERDVKKTR